MTHEQIQRIKYIKKAIFSEGLSLQDMVEETEGKDSKAIEKAIQDVDNAVNRLNNLIDAQ